MCMDDKKMKRLVQESKRMLYKMHPKYYYRDPFYSPNLSQFHNDFRIYVGSSQQKMNTVTKIETTQTQFEKNYHIKAKFDCISTDCWDYIFLQGYAFFENRFTNNQRTVQLLLEGETETLLIDTNKIYRPGFTGFSQYKKICDTDRI